MPPKGSAVYRIDIIKNGQRWTDTVGVAATPDMVAAQAVAYVCEAAVEAQPRPGDRSIAEVFDHQDQFVLRAELSVSGDRTEQPTVHGTR